MSKLFLVTAIVIGLAFNADMFVKGYSQPTPTPTPTPSQGALAPQQLAPEQQYAPLTPEQQQQLQQQQQQLQQTENQGQQRFQQLQQLLEQIQQRLQPDQVQLTPTPQQPQPTPPPQQTPLTPPQRQQLQQQQQQLQQQIQQIQQQLQQLQLQEQQIQQPQLQQPVQQIPPQQQQPQSEIPVNVRFVSIRIVDDEDPFPWGTGEWILDAFVSGQKVPLSANKFLNSADGGKTYQFPPTAQATVNVPPNGFLTINTIGVEVDGCDGNPQLIPAQLPPQVTKLLKTGGLPGLSTATKYLDTLGPALGLPLPPGALSLLSSLGLDPSKLVSSVKCALNDNDGIGEINQAYPGPGFGRGSKTVESDTGSFVLTYAITPRA